MGCYKILRIAALLTLLAGVYGCASTVRESQRDLNGSFDGKWSGSIVLTEEYQPYGHWEFTCKKFTASLALEIRDGAMGIAIDGGAAQRQNMFVSPAGAINTRIKLLNRPRMLITFKGALNAANGTGRGEFIIGNIDTPNGCKADWNVAKA